MVDVVVVWVWWRLWCGCGGGVGGGGHGAGGGGGGSGGGCGVRQYTGTLEFLNFLFLSLPLKEEILIKTEENQTKQITK